VPSQARCTRQRGPREADGRYTRSTRQVYGGLPACYLPCRATACRTRVRPVLLFRASTPLEDLGLPAPLPAGLYGRRAAPSKPVRGCPCGGPVGSQRPRTYSGQRRHGKGDPAVFVQVDRYIEGHEGAVCKTVGSAYVGSNPTPATTCGNAPLAANSRVSGAFLLRPVVCHLVTLQTVALRGPRTHSGRASVL
jgi:hypothetical protein